MDDPFLLASWIAKSMAGELSDEELQDERVMKSINEMLEEYVW